MVEASAFGIEGFMVNSVICRVLCQAFRASGSLFSIFGLKHTESQKQDWKNTFLFLLTDRLDRYLSCRPIYLNLIRYITMLILVNEIR